MTNKEIMDIAMQQSAYDTNAKVSDFLQDTNVFVKSGVGPLARKYYKEPIACNFVSYGSNVVASVKDEFKEISFDIKDDYEKKERTKVTLPVDLNYERTYSKDYENIYEKEYSNSSSSKYLEETKTNNNVNYNNIDSKESNTLNENFTLRENFYKDNVLDEKTSKIPKEYLSNTKDNERIPKFPPLRIIGQFNKTYILGEYDEVLYIIDQHAAHEKILFEKYFKNIEEGSIIIQPLLVPEIIDLTLDDFSYYEENKEIFKNAGFTLEEFGGNSLALKEVPYFLGKLDAKGLFLSILDNIKELGSGKTPEVKYNKIATMACKAAVKGHDLLSEQEMIKLVEDLRYINDPFHCPHGRPTIIKFTNYDLEKKFRRIV